SRRVGRTEGDFEFASFLGLAGACCSVGPLLAAVWGVAFDNLFGGKVDPQPHHAGANLAGIANASPTGRHLMRSALCITMIVLAIGAMALVGCGRGPKPAVGGTPGTLKAPNNFVGDVQITVFETKDSVLQPIGFGVTAADGTFQLYKNGAH